MSDESKKPTKPDTTAKPAANADSKPTATTPAPKSGATPSGSAAAAKPDDKAAAKPDDRSTTAAAPAKPGDKPATMAKPEDRPAGGAKPGEKPAAGAKPDEKTTVGAKPDEKATVGAKPDEKATAGAKPDEKRADRPGEKKPSSPPSGGGKPPAAAGGGKSGCLTSIVLSVLVVVLWIGAAVMLSDMWLPAAAPYIQKAMPAIESANEKLATIEAAQGDLTSQAKTLASGQQEQAQTLAGLAETQKSAAATQESLSTTQKSLSEKVAALAAAAEQPDEAVTSLSKQTTDMAAQMETMSRELNTLRDEVAALQYDRENAKALGPGGAPSEMVQTLARRVEAQSQRLDGLERALGTGTGRSPGGGVDAAALTALTDKLAALTSKVDSLETAQGKDVATQADVAALADRLSRLEADAEKTRDLTAAATTKAVAITQLVKAMEGSGPFAQELDRAIAVAGADSPIAKQLAPVQDVAAKGVPTLAALRHRFEKAVAEPLVHQRLKIEGEDWTARAVDRLTNLVAIRQTGDSAQGDDIPLHDAEQAVDTGDLASAIAAVERVEAPLPASATAWLAAAKARLAMTRAVDWMEVYAATDLPGKKG